jgi:hypothetical protein
MQDQGSTQRNESSKESSSWSRFSIRPWTEKPSVSASYAPRGSFVTPISIPEETYVERHFTTPSFVRGLLSNRNSRVHSFPMAMGSQYQNTPRPLKKPPLPRPNHEMRYKTINGGSSSSSNLVEMMTHNDHAKSVNAPPPICPSAEPEELEAAITLAGILNGNIPK